MVLCQTSSFFIHLCCLHYKQHQKQHCQQDFAIDIIKVNYSLNLDWRDQRKSLGMRTFLLVKKLQPNKTNYCKTFEQCLNHAAQYYPRTSFYLVCLLSSCIWHPCLLLALDASRQNCRYLFRIRLLDYCISCYCKLELFKTKSCASKENKKSL